MEIRDFINNYSGFFNGINPSHDDVDDYFTSENFHQMFGDSCLPIGMDWDRIMDVAHVMIDENSTTNDN